MGAHPFDRLDIGPVTLPNRLALAPMKTALGGLDGKVSTRHVAYYGRRAAGAAGLIITEPLYVASAGKEHPRQLGIDTDDKILGLHHLVEAVHLAGARIFAHVNHAGRAANPKASGQPPEAPSEMLCPATGATAVALDTRGIGETVEAFATAAARARAARFDGVELQCGLGYLIAQFLSARTNRRDDVYGGNKENRERFAREVIAAMRAALGPELPMTARISASEQVHGGTDIGDAKDLVLLLEALDVAAVHSATGSACDSPPWYYQHMSLPEGVNERLGAQIKAAASVPVMVAGRLGDPARIESVLREGQADVVALGRPLLADPDLPRKMRDGHAEQVVSCGSCLQGCLASVKAGQSISCIVNPEVGRESERQAAAGGERHVVVVGGGPAGLSAAVACRRRGLRVTLLEQAELGGQFALAHIAPGKGSMRRPLRSLLYQATHSGAEIRTGTSATVEEIVSLQPDAVVLATGAGPAAPNIPGLEQALTARQVLTGGAKVGRAVLVVGGGLVGIEVAEYLAEQCKAVTVVELLDDIARDMEAVTRKLTLQRLETLPIEILTSAAVESIQEGVARVRCGSNTRPLGPFDSFVVATGVRPECPLFRPLVRHGLEVHAIGDAEKLDGIMGAVRSGWEVARLL